MAVSLVEEKLYSNVKNVPCYVVGLTKQDARKRLEQAMEGTFVVRFSERTGGHCLTMKTGDAVRSFVILKDNDGKYTLDQITNASTVLELLRLVQSKGFLDSKQKRMWPTRPEANTVDENLDEKEWYMPDIDRGSSERYLEKCQPGTFLLRINRNGDLTLSVKVEDGSCKHVPINVNPSEGFFVGDLDGRDTVQELVEDLVRVGEIETDRDGVIDITAPISLSDKKNRRKSTKRDKARSGMASNPGFRKSGIQEDTIIEIDRERGMDIAGGGVNCCGTTWTFETVLLVSILNHYLSLIAILVAALNQLSEERDNVFYALVSIVGFRVGAFFLYDLLVYRTKGTILSLLDLRLIGAIVSYISDPNDQADIKQFVSEIRRWQSSVEALPCASALCYVVLQSAKDGNSISLVIAACLVIVVLSAIISFSGFASQQYVSYDAPVKTSIPMILHPAAAIMARVLSTGAVVLTLPVWAGAIFVGVFVILDFLVRLCTNETSKGIPSLVFSILAPSPLNNTRKARFRHSVLWGIVAFASFLASWINFPGNVLETTTGLIVLIAGSSALFLQLASLYFFVKI